MSIDPISAALDVGKSLIDRIWPDPVEAEKAKIRLVEISQQGDLAKLNAEIQLLVGQMEINRQEAQHKSIFVAGWRPFIGWVCGLGLAYAALLEPLMRFIARIMGYADKFPPIDTDITLQVLLGMLGLGIMRTREKEKGVNSDSIKDKK
jgi:hypothetical protein